MSREGDADVSGVFVTRGAALRIPPGGLVLTPDGIESVRVELRLDMWDRWLAIAKDATGRAQEAHAGLMKALTADREQTARYLEAECHAALVALSANAFAVDAFYASVKEHAPLPPELQQAWKKRRTARYKQIVETLKLSFVISDPGAIRLRDYLKALFEMRDQAVHPPNDWRAPVAHPLIGAEVEWRFVVYTAENATRALNHTTALFTQTLDNPKSRHKALREWAAPAKELLAAAVK